MRTVIALLVVAVVATGAGLFVTMVRQERCVRDVLHASMHHLSTWEAVTACERHRP